MSDNSQQNLYEINSPLNRCRICLMTDEEARKQIVSNICDCKGESGNVHIECLEMWIAFSNRDHCELCLQKIDIVRIPRYGILPSIAIFLNSSRISQALIFTILTGLIVYVTSILHINKLPVKPQSTGDKLLVFFVNVSVFASVFVVSYSPLICLYLWDAWKEWRKAQYYLEIRPRLMEV